MSASTSWRAALTEVLANNIRIYALDEMTWVSGWRHLPDAEVVYDGPRGGANR